VHFNSAAPIWSAWCRVASGSIWIAFYNELSLIRRGLTRQRANTTPSCDARPRAMHDAFEQFAAFTQDAKDNQSMLAKGGKIIMPVFAIGAEKSFGKAEAES